MRPLTLLITIDVEEEGLFSRSYPRTGATVTNVASLARLEFIPREFGLPLTLLVTYPVVQDGPAREVLDHWRQTHGAEIGVHLHPWNTPPFTTLPDPEPIRCRRLDRDLLEAKLETLGAAIQANLGVTPRSFRMGRFDWGPELLGLLPGAGITVDSSMVPLQQKAGGPDHFLLPPDPVFLALENGPGARVLEAPPTMVPLVRGTPELVYRLSRRLPRPWGEKLLGGFRYVAAANLQPAWSPLASMLAAARLHVRRGGRVLTMFLHSSELQPGATPNFPTRAAVDGLVAKIRAFLTRLTRTGEVRGLTLAELPGQGDWPVIPLSSWTRPEERLR